MSNQGDSSFLLCWILLSGVIVVCILSALSFVPMAECDCCSTIGKVTWEEYFEQNGDDAPVFENDSNNEYFWFCDQCSGRGKTTTGKPVGNSGRTGISSRSRTASSRRAQLNREAQKRKSGARRSTVNKGRSTSRSGYGRRSSTTRRVGARTGSRRSQVSS